MLMSPGILRSTNLELNVMCGQRTLFIANKAINQKNVR